MGGEEMVLSSCAIIGEPVVWQCDLAGDGRHRWHQHWQGAGFAQESPQCAVQEQGKFWANEAVRGKHFPLWFSKEGW